MNPTLVSGGVYKIINVASGSVVTLSTANGSSIEGHLDRNMVNQMWHAENVGGDHWTLKSVYQHQGRVVYLSSSGNNPTQGLPVTGAPDARQWGITQWRTRGGAEYRMWFPGAPRPGTVVDLAGGNHADGTVVQLWGTNDTAAQFWLFQKLPVPSAQANNEAPSS